MPPEVSLSPSFNTYSNNGKLAEIAARVVEEFDSDGFYGELYCETGEDSTAKRDGEGEDSKVSDEDFEFTFMRSDSDLSPADEVFRNGEIRPVYPVFNRDLLFWDVGFGKDDNKQNSVPDSVAMKAPKVRRPLKKLFMEERETTMTTTSSSSSEVDELDGVPEETYCVWRPKTAAEEEEGRCKKSNSGGCYSKRWKLKDLLHRSHSDGRKENFVFLNQSKKENRQNSEETPAGGGKMKPTAAPPPCNHDGGEKRRLYLPYKQDLAGYFGNVNGLSKKLQPF